jgi:hypothetical protein
MDNLTEIPFYRVPCDCGTSLEVTAAQAGVTLPCSACGKSVQIPSFTALQEKRPDGYIPTGKLRRYQFDLVELVAYVTVAALILSFYKSIEVFFSDSFLGSLLWFLGWFFVLSAPVLLILVVRRIIVFVGDFIEKMNARRSQLRNTS